MNSRRLERQGACGGCTCNGYARSRHEVAIASHSHPPCNREGGGWGRPSGTNYFEAPVNKHTPTNLLTQGRRDVGVLPYVRRPAADALLACLLSWTSSPLRHVSTELCDRRFSPRPCASWPSGPRRRGPAPACRSTRRNTTARRISVGTRRRTTFSELRCAPSAASPQNGLRMKEASRTCV